MVREKRAGQPRDQVNGDVWHARRHVMDAHGHGQGRHGASDTGRGSRAPLAMYEADPVLFTILEFFFSRKVIVWAVSPVPPNPTSNMLLKNNLIN